MYINIIKSIEDKAAADVIPNDEKINTLPPKKTRNKTRMHILSTFIRYNIEVLAIAIRGKKK